MVGCPFYGSLSVRLYVFRDATIYLIGESWRAASTVGLHAKWLKTKAQNIGAGPAPDPV